MKLDKEKRLTKRIRPVLVLVICEKGKEKKGRILLKVRQQESKLMENIRHNSCQLYRI